MWRGNVIGDVAGSVESPIYAILKMNQALKKLDARDFGGISVSGGPQRIKIYNAVQPFTDNQPAIKWDGECHITIEVFRDLGTAFICAIRPISKADGPSRSPSIPFQTRPIALPW